MYLGAMTGLIYLFFQPRRAGYPSKKILFVLLGLFLLFLIDGINSALYLIPGLQGLYTPKNWLRLLTGSGMGIVIAVMLVTVFNMVVWKDPISVRTLDKWRQFFSLAGCVAFLDLLMISQQPFLLFLFAILSTLTVIGILSLAYSVLIIMLWKQDNTFTSIQQYLPWLMGGLVCTFLQILLMDALRLALTGTWAGFTL